MKDDRSPVWVHRPLLNWRRVYAWGPEAGVKKMMPPEQLHSTQMTVREPVAWRDLQLRTDELVIPAGPKATQIFAWSIKALVYEHPEATARHAELLGLYPMMDHPHLRPHVSLYKGGRMPRIDYDGELVFGPEIASPFEAANVGGIKHVKIADII